MSNIKLVHCKESRFDVYIGRGSIYGNPFTSKKGSTLANWIVKTRTESISKFRTWLITSNDPEAILIRDNMHELKGKTLGCFCCTIANPNKTCHGNVYQELLDDDFAIEEFWDE